MPARGEERKRGKKKRDASLRNVLGAEGRGSKRRKRRKNREWQRPMLAPFPFERRRNHHRKGRGQKEKETLTLSLIPSERKKGKKEEKRFRGIFSEKEEVGEGKKGKSPAIASHLKETSNHVGKNTEKKRGDEESPTPRTRLPTEKEKRQNVY